MVLDAKKINCSQLLISEKVFLTLKWFRIWDMSPLNIVCLHDWYWKSTVHGYCSISVKFPPQIFWLVSIPHWSVGIRRALGCDSHPEGSLWAWGSETHTGGLYPGLVVWGRAASDGELGQHTFGIVPSYPQWDCLRRLMVSGWRGFSFSRDSSCWHSCIRTHWPAQLPVLLPP
jgi:hypothetical protein